MRAKREAIIACCCIIIGASLKKKLKEKKPKKTPRALWSREWLQRRDLKMGLKSFAIEELRLEDSKSFQNFCRMSKTTFDDLLTMVTPLIVKEDTVMRQSISPTTRLLLTLRYLATGSSYVDLSYEFRVSVPSIVNIIPETLAAIYSVLKEEFLKVPQSSEEWKNVAEGFQNKWNFPHCLGAIDGKHIAIRSRKDYGSYYYNYKGFNSIILLAVVDADYKFIYVSVGANGRANDAAAFNNSSLCRGIEANEFNFPEAEDLPYVFVADDGFKLTPWMMNPYGQRDNDHNKIFNYRLSRARRVVENAFGLLASKFRIFQTSIDLPVEKVEKLTLAACALHNFIRCRGGLHQGDVDVENTADFTFEQGTWRESTFTTGLQKSKDNRPKYEAKRIRDAFANYFNTTGAVSWQQEAIKKFNF